MSNEAKPVLKVQNYDRYDKTIEISGADFTVWVDNDDVPEGALVFATELAAAWNERDTLRATNAELVAALEAHEEAYGEPFHDDPPEDCDFDRQGGQRDCPKCVANAMTRAALSEARGGR